MEATAKWEDREHAYPRAFPRKALKTNPAPKINPTGLTRAYSRSVRTREISKCTEALRCADIGRRGFRRFGERKGKTGPIIVEQVLHSLRVEEALRGYAARGVCT
jgi:hypothetical protein